jgi:hypothetical protein
MKRGGVESYERGSVMQLDLWPADPALAAEIDTIARELAAGVVNPGLAWLDLETLATETDDPALLARIAALMETWYDPTQIHVCLRRLWSHRYSPRRA